jgi:LuxR family maltose regulon positive regulatory protein
MVDELTEREMELLVLLQTDLSRTELARTLGVSPNTVKSHFAAIYRKLGVHSRIAAVSRAREAGLL